MRRAASLFVLLSAAALHAQPPPPPAPPPPHDASQTRPLAGTGTIRGRVVADNGNEPLRKARVVIGGPTSIPPTFTDDQGRFAFTKLPAGQYALTARKAGYAAAAFGSRNPGEPPMRVDLAAGATVDGIEVRMTRGAAISGRLVDEFGEPIENAVVFAERVARIAGRTSTTSQASALSDDLGEYRLGGLPSGTYVVVARVARPPIVPVAAPAGTITFGGMDVTRSRTYYPGVVALADAQRIDVQAGEERSTIDFSALAAHALARLTLSFVDAKGNPTEAIPTLSSGEETTGGVTIGVPSMSTRVSTRIEPGAWTVYATGAAGVGINSVTIGSEDVAMTMALTKGGTISGRVIADGGRLPSGAVVEIEALPASALMQAFLARGSITRMGLDGAFELKDLLGVRQLRVRSAPPGWLTKAIGYKSRNLLDTDIEFKGGEHLAGVQVFLTDRRAELSGVVLDAQQTPLQRYSVVVFPEDERLLRDPRRLARLARPNQAGQFRIDDLLPGTYRVAAVSAVDTSQWLNADYLRRFLPIATRITVTESEKKSIVLPLVDAP